VAATEAGCAFSRSRITTRAPCAAIIRAEAKPSPFKPAPPVMIATLSFNSMIKFSVESDAMNEYVVPHTQDKKIVKEENLFLQPIQ
jgi:hypothetical protein